MSDLVRVVLASIVGVIAVARAVRLVTSDNWPPMEWARDQWNTVSARHFPDWSDLFTCPWCFAPYAVAVDLTWAILTEVQLDGSWGSAWWIVNGWAAASYVAPMIVTRDEPPPVDE
jgi:hypothetical protein